MKRWILSSLVCGVLIVNTGCSGLHQNTFSVDAVASRVPVVRVVKLKGDKIHCSSGIPIGGSFILGTQHHDPEGWEILVEGHAARVAGKGALKENRFDDWLLLEVPGWSGPTLRTDGTYQLRRGQEFFLVGIDYRGMEAGADAWSMPRRAVKCWERVRVNSEPTIVAAATGPEDQGRLNGMSGGAAVAFDSDRREFIAFAIHRSRNETAHLGTLRIMRRIPESILRANALTQEQNAKSHSVHK